MRVVLVLGQAQQGKTTLAWKLVRGGLAAPRVLVLDPVRSKPLSKAIEALDARAFSTWRGLSAWLASGQADGAWRAVLRSQQEADYAVALQAAPYYRHTALLVDEALWFVNSREAYEHLRKCARANAHFGGGLGVPLWLTAQRPMDIPPDIRSQATTVISFRQEEPRDLAFLAERCSPQFAEEVAALSNHNWVSYPPLNGEERSYADVEPESSVGNGGSRRAVGGVSAFPAGEHHREAEAVGQGVANGK